MPDANEVRNQETMEFQAEVKQLLNIVINSLYTDREIFLRELISNAADALEKFRYLRLTEKDVFDTELPLEIKIEVDEKEKTISIADTGIGMSKEEIIENLGTIAHSGSRAFLRHLAETDKKDVNLIGQFGVGFYSAFMVAGRVKVFTRSYRPNDQGYLWVSEGAGNYSLTALEGLNRGTRILLELKEDAGEFVSADNIKKIIKRYSGFVPFPIMVNGEKVNTVQAIWSLNKNEVKEEEYNEFYKYIANAFDGPMYRLHFSADAPLAINALLFVPENNYERYGFGKTEPGVNLYCRKVLIQQQAEGLLPEWLRFLKGVLDSEEIPLNISRETMQDSALMAKLRRVVTGRFLKFLAEQAKNDPDKYVKFWDTFGMFLKEGATSDFQHRKDIAPLLRFESSKSEPGKYTSLSEYVSRMKEDQKNIYFINGPNREVIEAGPYLEAFKIRDIEVIYTHEPIDDFVLSNLAEFEGKKLVSADQSDLDLPEADEKMQNNEEKLDSLTLANLTTWLQQALEGKVEEVRESNRLVDSPAVLINLDSYMTGTMQRVMQMVNKDSAGMIRKALEINPKHKLIKGLAELRKKDEEFAKLAAEQLYDNTLISAGMIADPRGMVDRMYKIMERAVNI